MSRCLKCTNTGVRIWPITQIDDETLEQAWPTGYNALAWPGSEGNAAQRYALSYLNLQTHNFHLANSYIICEKLLASQLRMRTKKLHLGTVQIRIGWLECPIRQSG